MLSYGESVIPNFLANYMSRYKNTNFFYEVGDDLENIFEYCKDFKNIILNYVNRPYFESLFLFHISSIKDKRNCSNKN